MAVIVAVAVGGVLGAPQYACTFTASSGNVYDLSNAYRDASLDQVDYTWGSTSDTGEFYVNVCGDTIQPACSPANGVCQITNVGPYGCGDAAQTKWTELRMSAIHHPMC